MNTSIGKSEHTSQTSSNFPLQSADYDMGGLKFDENVRKDKADVLTVNLVKKSD